MRLVLRKGPLFRRDRLEYAEIGDLDAAIAELAAAGLLDRRAQEDEAVDARTVLDLLLRDELVELLGELDSELDPAAIRGLRRPEVLRALLERHDPGVLRRAVARRTRGVLRPLGLDVLLVVRLLFFGNLGQSWSEFVVRDLGIVRYEPYPLRRELRLFAERAAVDHTLELRLTRRLVADLLDARALDSAVELAEGVRVDVQRWHPQAKRHADRILATVGRALERADRGEDALRLYAAAEGPPTRERRCRVLDRLGRCAEALDLARAIGEHPHDETEAAFAPAFVHRMERKLGLTARKWRRPRRPRVDLDLPPSVAGSVERGALAAFEAEGRRGVFAENWLWTSLFGLAFWDVIFAPVPGVFEHPFQLGPLDLHTAEFFRARRQRIEERIEQLRAEPDLAPRLWTVYEAKHGTANRLVVWHETFEPALRTALDLVPGEALAHVVERLVRDPGRYRRGFPDLLVEDAESPVGFELLEVKAPGDQLRPEQGAWIDHLNARGVPARVLRIRWLSDD